MKRPFHELAEQRVYARLNLVVALIIIHLIADSRTDMQSSLAAFARRVT